MSKEYIEARAKKFVERYHDFTDNKIHGDMGGYLAVMLSEAIKKGEEGIEEKYICNRKGVHTCRLGAIHIPDRFCGKIKTLLTPKEDSV